MQTKMAAPTLKGIIFSMNIGIPFTSGNHANFAKKK
jgi:hypothetical protein